MLDKGCCCYCCAEDAFAVCIKDAAAAAAAVQTMLHAAVSRMLLRFAKDVAAVQRPFLLCKGCRRCCAKKATTAVQRMLLLCVQRMLLLCKRFLLLLCKGLQLDAEQR